MDRPTVAIAATTIALVPVHGQFADDEAALLALETEDDEEGGEATIKVDEEATTATSQRNLRGLEGRRGRKIARISKQEAAIADKQDEIAAQRAELVELQAQLDHTKIELRQTDTIMVEVSQRIHRPCETKGMCRATTRASPYERISLERHERPYVRSRRGPNFPGPAPGISVA